MEINLNCPVCGISYSHLVSTPNESTCIIDEIKDTSADWVIMLLSCENGHLWSLIIRQSKGELFLIQKAEVTNTI